jgi:hypothetical protein
MVVVREKTTVTQRIHGNCPTRSRTKIAVRDVGTVLDEPKEREGTKMGPTATETMVAALIACTNVISHKCAKRHGVELKVMTIDAESTFDRRGALRARNCKPSWKSGRSDADRPSPFPGRARLHPLSHRPEDGFLETDFDFLEQLRSGT